MKMSALFRGHLMVLTGLLIAAGATAQTVWDGDTDPNNSGNWSVADNWDTDLVPADVDVELNDVTSGTRTVTFDSVNPRIGTELSINQSTDGAVNALVIDGATLEMDMGSTVIINPTDGTASLSIINGGVLNTDDNRSGGENFVDNAGILNVGSPTSSGDLTVTRTGFDPRLIIDNSGTANVYGTSILGTPNRGEGITFNNTGTLNPNVAKTVLLESAPRRD